MLKTLVILPDGTELSSGTEGTNAIKSLTLTECVNDGQELSLGSVCANMIELTVISPNGGLLISEADELQVYSEDPVGTRYPIGIFIAEKPVWTGANTLKITAFDRVCLLDKDLTDWFNGLSGWPYTLFQLSKAVCEVCGLELVNTQFPNGSRSIQQFALEQITGRKLLQWAAQISGKFCRATADGKLEFAWYTPSAVSIGAQAPASVDLSWDDQGCVALEGSISTAVTDTGNMTLLCEGIAVEEDGEGNVRITLPQGGSALGYYADSLSYSDYQVAKLQKISLDTGENTVLINWPADLNEAVNTYTLSANALLTAASKDTLSSIAKTLYNNLKDVTYTPCNVTVPASDAIHAGSIVNITDRGGKTITAYVMTKRRTGQKETLECTGSARRDSSTAVNDVSLRDISGKVTNLQMTVDGLKASVSDVSGIAASMILNAEGIQSEVTRQNEEVNGIKTQLSAVEQTANDLKITVGSVLDDGVDQVQTKTGYTFNEDGLTISKDGSEMENKLDETGMYVHRNGELILQANNEGVKAVDVTVGNYLIIGDHARFEDYSNGTDTARTACFWI